MGFPPEFSSNDEYLGQLEFEMHLGQQEESEETSNSPDAKPNIFHTQGELGDRMKSTAGKIQNINHSDPPSSANWSLQAGETLCEGHLTPK